MAVIPTYSTGIGAPDLAGAFLGGRRIAQEAYSDAARIQFGREQLAQQAIQNEMELAAKKEALSRESLRRAQEQEIEKAYRETQLGLAERELKNAEAMNALKIQEMARSFDAQQTYQRRVKELAPKMGYEEAARQAILETGGTGLSTALERPQGPSQLPEANFRYRQIQGQIDDRLRPYSGNLALAIPEKVKKEVEALRQQQSQLLPPTTSTVTGGGVQPSQAISSQGYMYPPMPGQVPSGTQIPPMIGQVPSGTQIPSNPVQFNTAEDVRAAFRAQKISRDEAKKILAERFGMK